MATSQPYLAQLPLISSWSRASYSLPISLSSYTASYHLNNQTINKVQSTKYLGLTITTLLVLVHTHLTNNWLSQLSRKWKSNDYQIKYLYIHLSLECATCSDAFKRYSANWNDSKKAARFVFSNYSDLQVFATNSTGNH